MMNQMSLLAYEDNVKPVIGHRQQQVLTAIEELQPCCNQEIANHLKWPINMVTGRVKELRDKRRVVMCHQDIYHFGRRVNFWSTKSYKDLFYGNK